MDINKLILRIILISLLLFFSCKKNSKIKADISKQNLISQKDTLSESSQDKLRGVIGKKIVYFYTDAETNDSQKIIITWKKNINEFDFSLITDTDMCEYKDKGKANFKENGIYTVANHPTLKYIKFNDDKTTVELVCDYGNQRDECDPIQEFKMKKE
ncbi:hypothetical protein ACSTS3_22680 [Aquimarina muelleri]|uniref:hypothetical protein n=1 Tax=Aquimarina muelleri TaxID=279356 RepID=UPI003F684277